MLRNRALFFCALTWAFFWVVAPFINRPYVFDFVDGCGIVLSGAVLISYFPGLKAAYLNKQDLERSHYLILGVAATWLALSARLIMLWVWRWMGQRPEGMNSLMMAFTVWMLITGGTFHLLAPNVINGQVPRSGWRYLFITLALGISLGLSVALFRYFFDADPMAHDFIWKGQ